MPKVLRVTVALGMALLGLVSAGAADKLQANAKTAPANVASLFEDPVVAKGKGVEVKQSQVEEAFTAFKAKMAVRSQPIPEIRRPVLEAQLLDSLIVARLLVNRASDADKAKAKESAERSLADFKKVAGSEDILRSQLKARGLTFEQFSARTHDEELARIVMERELKSKLSISDAQVEEFYKSGTDAVVKIMQAELERLAKNPDTTLDQLAAVKKEIDGLKRANLSRLELPEKVRVSHILITTRNRQTEEELPDAQKKTKRELAEKLLARARAGEDFAKLIREFSEDRNVKETKGEYTLARSDPFVPEFKAAAFSLGTNQISDIVTTIFGYHIIKLHERIPARKMEFEKVSAEIKDALLQQETQRQMPDYFERLKKEADVEILDARYKLESPKSSEPLKTGS